MPYLLNAADIYAAPSRLEGYGMIQVEAQACGVPVISINDMGPKETIAHGTTGFLANVGETVELKEEWAYTHMGFEEDHKIQFEKQVKPMHDLYVEPSKIYADEIVREADSIDYLLERVLVNFI